MAVSSQQFGEIKNEVKNLADLQKEHREEHREDHKEMNGKIDLHEERSLDRYNKLKWMVVGSTLLTGTTSLFNAEVKDVIIAMVNSFINSAQAFL